MVIRHNLLSS